jgi:hypothetical protein
MCGRCEKEKKEIFGVNGLKYLSLPSGFKNRKFFIRVDNHRIAEKKSENKFGETKQTLTFALPIKTGK